MKNLNQLDLEQLDILFEALCFFACNADYEECQTINHLKHDDIDEITIKLRKIISHQKNKLQYKIEQENEHKDLISL